MRLDEVNLRFVDKMKVDLKNKDGMTVSQNNHFIQFFWSWVHNCEVNSDKKKEIILLLRIYHSDRRN